MKKAVLAAILVIGGCANHPLDCATGLVAWDDCLPGTAGYNIRQRGQANLQLVRQSQEQEDDRLCQSFGAQPGSETYVNCRVQLYQTAAQNSQATAAQRAAALQAWIASQPRQPSALVPYVVPNPTPLPSPKVCNSQSFDGGRSVTTTCN